MANKKLNQLVTKPSIASGDLFPIADSTTGQLYKTTISDLGTAIGSGVSSVNGLVGAVVLDTDDIQELASPVNKWFTDLRARAAISVSSPLAYNSGTGLITIAQATGLANGYLSSTDWTTFNSKQAALSGTGFVKSTGGTISYDTNTYLTTSAAATNYVPYTGATANVNLGLNYSLTAALIIKSGGTSTQFLKADGSIDTNTYLTTGSAASTYLPLSGGTISGDLTISSTNPRIYLTDTDNNPDYFISNTDGTFTIYDVTSSVSRFTLNGTTGTFGGNLTVGSIIKSGGTSSQFLKADGSVDSTAYVSGSGTTNYLPRWSSSKVLTDSFIYTNGNYTEIQGQGLTASMGIVVSGRYGSVANAPKIYSSDETTGVAHIEFVNGGGEIRIGVEKSTGGQILPGSSAYATVLTAGLSARNLEFGTNNTKRMTIDGSTGAVTLTGALSGTSATFSSGLVSQGAFTGFQYNSAGAYPAYNTYFGAIGTNFSNSNSELDIWNTVGGGFVFRKQTGASAQTALLTIANSGAATFSSSVTATQMGIGVSTLPSWTGARAIQAGLAGSYYGDGQVYGWQTGMVANAYRTGATTWAYQNTGIVSTRVEMSEINPFSIFIAPSGTAGNTISYTQALTLTSSGNVGIGTTSPSEKLHLAGASNNVFLNEATSGNYAINRLKNSTYTVDFGVDASGMYLDGSTGAFRYYNGSSERMRITSGGDVAIGYGGSANSGKLTVVNATGNMATLWNTASTGNNGFISFCTEGTISEKGYIYYNRAANVVALVSTSDQRLKKDIIDASSVFPLIDKIKVREYKWKETGQTNIGFIAQELYQVIDRAVSVGEDNPDGTIKRTWGVDNNILVPYLVKAVQELKAELDTLKNI